MKRMVIAATMLALATLSPGAAEAGKSSFHFSLGVPHCGWHGHCHYPRPYIYAYAPPPPVYVYPQPTYVAPAYVPAASAPAPSSWTGRSEPRTNALPASQTITSAVTIRNPASTGGAVGFVIDGSDEVTLSAGQTQTLNNQGSYTVEFDRGGDFGIARKTLTSGAYEFQVTDRGWDLVEASRVATRATVRRNELPDTKLR